MPTRPWFTDAKLGVFVHGGINAVDGVQVRDPRRALDRAARFGAPVLTKN
ncbi:hypothetical protein GCM10027074_15550 [Streptomyces deserti]